MRRKPRPKNRKITAAEYDEAVVSEIKHIRGNLNVPKNAISQVFTFANILGNRMYGVRNQDERTAEFNELFKLVITEAVEERKAQDSQSVASASNLRRTPGGIILP